MDKKEKLLKLLISKKVTNTKEIEEYEKISGITEKSIEDILVENNKIDSEKIIELKAGIYGLKYKNLLDKKVEDNVLNVIPLEVAENYKIVCFEKENNIINVGILNPDNFKAMEAINFLAKEEKIRVDYYLISNLSFERVFKQYKNLKKEVSTALENKEKEDELDAIKNNKKNSREELEGVIKSAPVAKIVSVIIKHAVEGRASDIHIEPSQEESRIRYRIDGVLHTSIVLPKSVHRAIVARIKVLADLKLDETRIPQDGRIRISFGNKAVDFRISILPLIGEEKVVMRILDTTRGASTLEELGYSGQSLNIILENIKKTNGMFLVTGPTGSGKSTTLFSVLNMLNKEGVNISTLEDPVEYFIKGVNQSQIKPEIGFNFASGLRSFLRQDPDIIMVGEIRDNETAELAIHAALTGHSVLSTLHTNSTVGTIPRLLDMEVEPFLLGSTLNIVVAQRLARKICSHCREKDVLPKDILENIDCEIKKIPEKILKQELGNFKNSSELTFYKGKGCPRCGNSGYNGRVAVVEVLDVNDSIKKIIMDKNRMLQMEEVEESQDFITMKQDGIIKSIKGMTTMEEILRVIKD